MGFAPLNHPTGTIYGLATEWQPPWVVARFLMSVETDKVSY